jgi:hypothetical protein
MKVDSETTRSTEFLEGFGACASFITRTRNPFPRLIDEKLNPKWVDWYEGWNTRFYGESIYEG